MTQQQRYTGPELSALLREVRAELGDQATIHEANRIRTGGVGGFFRKEGFEVLASPPPSHPLTQGPVEGTGVKRRLGIGRAAGAQPATTGTGHLALSDSIEADEDLIAKLTAAMESEQAWVDAIGASTSPPPAIIEKRPVRRFAAEDLAPIDDAYDRITPATTVASSNGARGLLEAEPALSRVSTPGQALLDRVDTVSANERVGQLMSGARGLIDDATIADRTRPLDESVSRPFGGAVPPRGLMDEAAAVARVNSPLHRIDPTEMASAGTTATMPSHSKTLEAGATDAAPLPRAERAFVAEPAATIPTQAAIGPSNEADGAQFWNELTRLEGILPIRPTTQASVQLLVGPLDIALPLATRFASDPTIELNVLTDEVALAGIRPDQLAESSRDLHHRLLDRSNGRARGIGVIEADDGRRERGESLEDVLTPRLLTMVDRVCADGAVDLLRLTLRSLGPIEEMQQLIDSFLVPCAIDLGSAPTAAELDEALDARLPIVSIAGRQLTPALAMALTHR